MRLSGKASAMAAARALFASLPLAMYSLLLPAARGGTCEDRRTDCFAWARDGHCASNPDYMAQTCPLACGICDYECADSSDLCPTWAAEGECYNNALAMYKDCPVACGVCAPQCADAKLQCAAWAADGECNANPAFMGLHCPVSCDVCVLTCLDRATDCPSWAAAGECNSNPEHMLRTCPTSCSVCEGLRCADKNVTQCHIWADAGECQRNPLAVMKLCPSACGVCSTACRDQDPSCGAWAMQGRCGAETSEHEPSHGVTADEERAFMLRACPASCGLCSAIDGGKDEL